MTSPITHNNNNLPLQTEQILNQDYKKISKELRDCILNGLDQFAKKAAENVPIGIVKLKDNCLIFGTINYSENEIEVLHRCICSPKKRKFTKKMKDKNKLDKIQQKLKNTEDKIIQFSNKPAKLATLKEKSRTLQSEIDQLKNMISTKAAEPLIGKNADEAIQEDLTRKDEIIESKLRPYNSCIILYKIIGYKVRFDYKNFDIPPEMKFELDKLLEQNNLNNALSFQF